MGDYSAYFRGKQITLIGLGLLGRGVNVAKFLAECGADMLVTDLKTKDQLQPSLKKLARFKNIRFVLGEHRLENFRGVDMVIKAAGVPLDSPFIAEARSHGVPVKMDASLFAELAPPGVLLVGITGTRGKSTTTQLLYEVLNDWRKVLGVRYQVGGRSGHELPSYQLPVTSPSRSHRVFLGGNIRGMATLPLLKKVRPGDIVVLELDSWQLQGFGEAKISPHVAVFTTFFDDHLNYYDRDRGRYLKDKANIFTYQSGVKNFQFSIFNFQTRPVLIVGAQAAPLIRKHFAEHAQRMKVVRPSNVPKNWKLAIPGEHNRANAASALVAADALGVPRSVSKRAITSFHGLPGRLELVRELRGVKIYNDTCATTPEATIAALRALGRLSSKQQAASSKVHRIILIMGGADKGLDMSGLLKEIPRYCRAVIWLPGTGTNRIMKHESRSMETEAIIHYSKFLIQEMYTTTLSAAIKQAVLVARKGDSILFSPAFASFGMFKNEYDRGEKFNRAVAARKDTTRAKARVSRMQHNES
ncbi:MAG: Mur ligase family protein [bacterium]|nr:Mur ligase family protein [bacterium]MDZ4284580.1 Mur ligase family protein [Patescibacteria group bacterium]